MTTFTTNLPTTEGRPETVQNIRRQPWWSSEPAIQAFDHIWSHWRVDLDNGEHPLAQWDFVEYMAALKAARNMIWDYKIAHFDEPLPKGLRQRQSRVMTIYRWLRSNGGYLPNPQAFSLGEITTAVVGLV